MKLLFENWRKYLTEDEMRSQIMTYLEENNIVLTEEEIEEGMPRWMRKLGTGAALAATLASAGGVGQSAEAGWFGGGDTESSQEQQAPEEGPSEDGDSFTAKFKVGDDIQMSMEQADSDAMGGLGKPGSITSRTQVGGYVYSTATAS